VPAVNQVPDLGDAGFGYIDQQQDFPVGQGIPEFTEVGVR
jgi:hypothetical protein